MAREPSSLNDWLLPPDHPDVHSDGALVFTTRRKAERLPSLRPAVQSSAFDPTWCRGLARADWQAGFRWGILASVGGACLAAVVAVAVLK